MSIILTLIGAAGVFLLGYLFHSLLDDLLGDEPTFRVWTGDVHPQDAVVVLIKEAELPLGSPTIDAAASDAATKAMSGGGWWTLVLLKEDWQEASSWMGRNQVPR